jgi:hypothetical protein
MLISFMRISERAKKPYQEILKLTKVTLKFHKNYHFVGF